MTLPLTLNLWPGLAPGETTSDPGHVDPNNGGNVTRLTNITCPQMLVYGLAGQGSHPTMLVCPGGAYSHLAADLEGSEIAQWLHTQGYVAVILHYRVPDKRDAAFHDAERARAVSRERAKEFGIRPLASVFGRGDLAPTKHLPGPCRGGVPPPMCKRSIDPHHLGVLGFSPDIPQPEAREAAIHVARSLTFSGEMT